MCHLPNINGIIFEHKYTSILVKGRDDEKPRFNRVDHNKSFFLSLSISMERCSFLFINFIITISIEFTAYQ